MLQGMNYQNCIRTEEGYCAIEWKQSSTTTPDPFGIGTEAAATAAAAAATPVITTGTGDIESNDCSGTNGYIGIPNLSPDGINPIPILADAFTSTLAAGAGGFGALPFQDQVCGSDFGIDGMGTISQPLVCKLEKSTSHWSNKQYRAKKSLQRQDTHFFHSLDTGRCVKTFKPALSSNQDFKMAQAKGQCPFDPIAIKILGSIVKTS